MAKRKKKDKTSGWVIVLIIVMLLWVGGSFARVFSKKDDPSLLPDLPNQQTSVSLDTESIVF